MPVVLLLPRWTTDRAPSAPLSKSPRPERTVLGWWVLWSQGPGKSLLEKPDPWCLLPPVPLPFLTLTAHSCPPSSVSLLSLLVDHEQQLTLELLPGHGRCVMDGEPWAQPSRLSPPCPSSPPAVGGGCLPIIPAPVLPFFCSFRVYLFPPPRQSLCCPRGAGHPQQCLWDHVSRWQPGLGGSTGLAVTSQHPPLPLGPQLLFLPILLFLPALRRG